MTKHITTIFFMIAFAMTVSGAEPVQNPIIWADVPDMAMVRVDDTYYMSSTTMHMAPGLPIMKSKNLVDWDLVGYAYDILENNAELSLRNGKNSYGKGSWASSIRYHNATFYVTTFAQSTNKTHVYTTKDIEKGPWKETAFSPMLHDHSLFFDDDGRVYMLYGVQNLRLVELSPDVSGLKPGGVNEVVIQDVSLIGGATRRGLGEGTQMFKKDGKYYVNNITWPPGDMRTQVLSRADKITGPYKGRVILKDAGIAQGSLIDTPDGKWYAYLFGDRGAVGRIPYLVPIEWEDGWPILGTDGKVPVTLNIPMEGTALGNIVASDEFERSDTLLAKLKASPRGENDYVREAFPLAWQWNHNPDNRYWSLTDRLGWLRLTAGRTDKSFLEARNSLTQRTFGPECSATTLIDVSNMKDGDYTGLAALQKQYGFVGVKMQNGEKSVVMVNTENDLPREEESAALNGNLVHLKIECDFKDQSDIARFYWSVDGKNWKTIGKPLQMRYTLPHFMGYRFALFYFATQNTGGFADFDYYRIAGAPAIVDINGHTNTIYAVAVSPDGNKIITCDTDVIRIWDVKSRKELQTLIGHQHTNFVAFTPDEKQIITWSRYHRTARIWDTGSGTVLHRLEKPAGTIYELAVSPDGKKIVTASHDHIVRIWETDSGEELHKLRGHSNSVVSVAFSPDGTKVVTASYDGTAGIWNVASGERLQTMRHENQQNEDGTFSVSGVFFASFSPDGKRIVTASMDTTARIWDAESGEILHRFVGHTSTVTTAVFSPDGNTVLTSSYDSTARIWDADTGKELYSFANGYPTAFFSPNGKIIVTQPHTNPLSIQILETDSRQKWPLLRNCHDDIQAIAFFSDSKKMVTVGFDRTIRIWDLEQLRPIERLPMTDD